jgi:hypothetical protein
MLPAKLQNPASLRRTLQQLIVAVQLFKQLVFFEAPLCVAAEIVFIHDFFAIELFVAQSCYIISVRRNDA